jgi:hypothetical protein
MSTTAGDALLRLFIHELDAAIRSEGSVSILDVARVIVPKLGVSATEAVLLMDHVDAEGIVGGLTRPNPDDPGRPTRCLYLVRDHPVVKAVLAGQPIPTKELPPSRTDIKLSIRPPDGESFFEAVPIRGEPASATLIRERR